MATQYGAKGFKPGPKTRRLLTSITLNDDVTRDFTQIFIIDALIRKSIIRLNQRMNRGQSNSIRRLHISRLRVCICGCGELGIEIGRNPRSGANQEMKEAKMKSAAARNSQWIFIICMHIYREIAFHLKSLYINSVFTEWPKHKAVLLLRMQSTTFLMQ